MINTRLQKTLAVEATYNVGVAVYDIVSIMEDLAAGNNLIIITNSGSKKQPSTETKKKFSAVKYDTTSKKVRLNCICVQRTTYMRICLYANVNTDHDQAIFSAIPASLHRRAAGASYQVDWRRGRASIPGCA